MNWNAAIERNGEALKRILAVLIAMASGEATLPRHLHRAILALLRPTEAAARRLIIVAARGLVVPPPHPRKVKPKSGSIFVRNGKGTGILLSHGIRPTAVLPGVATPRPAPRSLALSLSDTLRRLPGRRNPLAGGVPRFSVPGISEPHASCPAPPGGWPRSERPACPCQAFRPLAQPRRRRRAKWRRRCRRRAKQRTSRCRTAASCLAVAWRPPTREPPPANSRGPRGPQRSPQLRLLGSGAAIPAKLCSHSRHHLMECHSGSHAFLKPSTKCERRGTAPSRQ